MQHPMSEVLVKIAPNKIADEMMQGTFAQLDRVSDEIREVFNYLALKDGMESVYRPTPMTIDECQQGCNGVKVRTS